jgi:hypothetical protein
MKIDYLPAFIIDNPTTYCEKAKNNLEEFFSVSQRYYTIQNNKVIPPNTGTETSYGRQFGKAALIGLALLTGIGTIVCIGVLCRRIYQHFVLTDLQRRTEAAAKKAREDSESQIPLPPPTTTQSEEKINSEMTPEQMVEKAGGVFYRDVSDAMMSGDSRVKFIMHKEKLHFFLDYIPSEGNWAYTVIPIEPLGLETLRDIVKNPYTYLKKLNNSAEVDYIYGKWGKSNILKVAEDAGVPFVGSRIAYEYYRQEHPKTPCIYFERHGGQDHDDLVLDGYGSLGLPENVTVKLIKKAQKKITLTQLLNEK